MDPAGGQFEFFTGAAVKGQILTERLSRGSLSVREALQYAVQIGETLHYAHSAGLVHGALSPASIALTDEGATLLRPADLPAARLDYRSPEQVRGEAPDPGSDIFAFGALLYEMLVGRPAFGGPDEELDRAILESPILWPDTGQAVPAALREIIASLTQKDKGRRRQRIQNAVIELKLVARFPARKAAVAREEVPPLRVEQSPRRFALWGRRVAAIAMVLLALAASSVAAALLFDRRPPTTVFKFSIAAPEPSGYMGGAALSRDASRIVFSAFGTGGQRTLWLRSLDALHANDIPGTEGASEPFWSPDGQSIGFFANGSLLRIGRAGETRTTICSTEDMAGGGSWNPEGLIVFAPGLARSIYLVSAAGGVPQVLIPLDSAKGERSMLWPQFLPDGRHFVFFNRTEIPETTGVYLGSIDGAEHHLLLRSESSAVYAGIGTEKPGGSYLLFIRHNALVAQPFDLSRLTLRGEPTTVADEIDAFASLSLIPVTASDNGVLAYQSAGKHTRQLIWMDRKGVQLGMAAAPGNFGIPRLSADGNRLAVGKLESDGRQGWVWLLNPEGAGARPAAQEGADRASEVEEVSPDGKWIAYQSDVSGAPEIYLRSSHGFDTGTAMPHRVSGNGGVMPRWSRDGAQLYYLSPGGELMAVSVRAAGMNVETGAPLALFHTRQAPDVPNSFDVSADGQRFIVNVPLEDATASPVTIVTSWAGNPNPR